MNKKKEEQPINIDPIEQLKRDVNKKYDANVVINAQEIVEKERKIISVSPALDIALYGGIPEGSWCLLSGPAKSGKTITSLQIAANAQQQFNKPVFIGAVEHRLNKKELQGIHGLDASKITVIQSERGKVLTAQDFLQEFSNIIKTVIGCVLIIDSTSALCSENEYSSDITPQFRSEGPKLLASFCRRNASIVPIQDVTLIVIQHLITNTNSSYGSPYYEDGGVKIQYQADVKLRAISFQKWNAIQNDDTTRIGQVVNWNVINSALGPPGSKVQSYIRYNYGIDFEKEIIGLGLDMGVIMKGGSWYSIQYNDQEYKYQGEEKLRNGLMENPELLKYIKNNIKM